MTVTARDVKNVPTLKIIISNNITLTDYDKETARTVRDVLTLPNPNFERIKRITGSQFAADRDFKYYKEKDGLLVIPRGMRGRLLGWLDSKKIAYDLTEDFIEKPLSRPMFLKLELRNYQKDAIEILSDEREGIMEMGTGAGKTAAILGLIEKIGLTACILVPTLPILKQFIKEAEDFYGLKIGQVGDGKKEINFDIIVSTFQSLSMDEVLLKNIAAKTSIVIEDECQQGPAKGRMKIIRAFKPKHLFGASATVMRSDGKTKAIEFVFGKIKHQYADTPLIPKVEVINTRCEIPMSYSYHEIIDSMVRDKSRNKLISGLIIGNVLEGRKVLVLTKRIEHYQSLKALLPESDKFFFIESSDKTREDKLEKLNNGELEFSAIFGTTALLAVGVNIKPCDTLIITCDIKAESLTRQAIGRVLRKHSKKKDPLIIDLADMSNPILRRQYYERRKVYESQGWEVVTNFDTKK